MLYLTVYICLPTLYYKFFQFSFFFSIALLSHNAELQDVVPSTYMCDHSQHKHTIPPPKLTPQCSEKEKIRANGTDDKKVRQALVQACGEPR